MSVCADTERLINSRGAELLVDTDDDDDDDDDDDGECDGESGVSCCRAVAPSAAGTDSLRSS